MTNKSNANESGNQPESLWRTTCLTALTTRLVVLHFLIGLRHVPNAIYIVAAGVVFREGESVPIRCSVTKVVVSGSEIRTYAKKIGGSRLSNVLSER